MRIVCSFCLIAARSAIKTGASCQKLQVENWT